MVDPKYYKYVLESSSPTPFPHSATGGRTLNTADCFLIQTFLAILYFVPGRPLMVYKLESSLIFEGPLIFGIHMMVRPLLHICPIWSDLTRRMTLNMKKYTLSPMCDSVYTSCLRTFGMYPLSGSRCLFVNKGTIPRLGQHNVPFICRSPNWYLKMGRGAIEVNLL